MLSPTLVASSPGPTQKIRKGAWSQTFSYVLSQHVLHHHAVVSIAHQHFLPATPQVLPNYSKEQFVAYLSAISAAP